MRNSFDKRHPRKIEAFEVVECQPEGVTDRTTSDLLKTTLDEFGSRMKACECVESVRSRDG